MFDSRGVAYAEVWKPCGGRLALVDIGPRIVVPEQGDWRRWKRLASKREIAQCIGGPSPKAPSGYDPAIGGSRLAYLLSTAILKLNPAATYVTIATGVSNWANSGTASTSLDVAQATGSKQPAWGAAAGRNGGPGLTFTAASLQYLVSGAYTWNQPSTQITRGQTTTATTGYTYADGKTTINTRRMYVGSATTINMHAGTALGTTRVATSWTTVAGVFNGTSSAVSCDGGTPATGNAGSAAATGLTVGAAGNATQGFIDGTIDWAIGADYAYSATDVVLMAGWLALR